MRKLSDVLGGGAVEQDILRAAKAQRAMKCWDEAVGEILASKTFADRYDHGTLWIVAEASAWGQEIVLRQEEIVDRLNTLANEPGLFKKIRVGARSIKLM